MAPKPKKQESTTTNSNAAPSASFSDMPTEVLINIFRRLDNITLEQFAQVSHTPRQVAIDTVKKRLKAIPIPPHNAPESRWQGYAESPFYLPIIFSLAKEMIPQAPIPFLGDFENLLNLISHNPNINHNFHDNITASRQAIEARRLVLISGTEEQDTQDFVYLVSTFHDIARPAELKQAIEANPHFPLHFEQVKERIGDADPACLITLKNFLDVIQEISDVSQQVLDVLFQNINHRVFQLLPTLSVEQIVPIINCLTQPITREIKTAIRMSDRYLTNFSIIYSPVCRSIFLEQTPQDLQTMDLGLVLNTRNLTTTQIIENGNLNATEENRARTLLANSEARCREFIPDATAEDLHIISGSLVIDEDDATRSDRFEQATQELLEQRWIGVMRNAAELTIVDVLAILTSFHRITLHNFSTNVLAFANALIDYMLSIYPIITQTLQEGADEIWHQQQAQFGLITDFFEFIENIEHSIPNFCREQSITNPTTHPLLTRLLHFFEIIRVFKSPEGATNPTAIRNIGAYHYRQPDGTCRFHRPAPLSVRRDYMLRHPDEFDITNVNNASASASTTSGLGGSSSLFRPTDIRSPTGDLLTLSSTQPHQNL
jgi:hypothetical protein